MAEEGAVQLFRPVMGSDYILGAVGVLQFDVTMARLKAEYGVDAVYESVDYALARWVSCDDEKILKEFEKRNVANMALDAEGHLAFLTPGDWWLANAKEKFPEIVFHKTREYN